MAAAGVSGVMRFKVGILRSGCECAVLGVVGGRSVREWIVGL